MVIDGADIIDVGGESTRPGADDITSDEELRRAAVEAGADIVNDVSGGTYDPDMFSTVAALGVPIILMSFGLPTLKSVQYLAILSSLIRGG